MDQQILIVLVLGVVCFGALAVVLLAPNQKDKTKKRVEEMNVAKVAKRGGGNAEAQSKERRKKLADTLAALEDKTKNLKKKRRLSMEQMLEQAGLPIKRKHFYIGSVVLALFFALVGLISGQQPWITGLLLLIGGFGFPRWVLNFLRKRRQKKFVDEFFLTALA